MTYLVTAFENAFFSGEDDNRQFGPFCGVG